MLQLLLLIRLPEVLIFLEWFGFLQICVMFIVECLGNHSVLLEGLVVLFVVMDFHEKLVPFFQRGRGCLL